MTPAARQSLDDFAERKGTSSAAVAREAINEYIARHGAAAEPAA